MKTYGGIEIGGTKLQVVSGDEKATIRERFKYDVTTLQGSEGILQNIKLALSKLNNQNLQAIGVGFGGPIDRGSGKIWTSYHISGWSGFNLKKYLEELTGLRVYIDNDANVAALAEATHGAGQNLEHVFYVTMGSGVGGGLVVNGSIYHGALPGETELGHIRLDKSGRTVQDSCSGWAVNEKIRERVKSNPNSPLAQLSKKFIGTEAKALVDALKINDSVARDILHETADDFVFGLSHVIHLIHPDTIILGGGLSLIGEPLRKLVEEKLRTYIMDAFQPGPMIKLASLKEDAVPVGALQLAIQNS